MQRQTLGAHVHPLKKWASELAGSWLVSLLYPAQTAVPRVDSGMAAASASAPCRPRLGVQERALVQVITSKVESKFDLHETLEGSKDAFFVGRPAS